MKITLTILDVIIILAIIFFIVEYRIYQTKKRMVDAITGGIIVNNKNIEELLNRKDDVMKEILHRLTDEIFDGRDALRDELMEKIKEVEKKTQNYSENV